MVGSRGFGVAKIRLSMISAEENNQASNTMYCMQGLYCNYLDGKKHYCACTNRVLPSR